MSDLDEKDKISNENDSEENDNEILKLSQKNKLKNNENLANQEESYNSDEDEIGMFDTVTFYNEDDDEYYTFSLTTRARSRMAIGSSIQSDGAVRLMLTQTMGSSMQSIKDTSGALVTFQLKAAGAVAGTKNILILICMETNI